ncbi:MAG: hypothetical protein WCW27_03480 [Patescibacteria group bacterium]|jgi:hypothetical protein
MKFLIRRVLPVLVAIVLALLVSWFSGSLNVMKVLFPIAAFGGMIFITVTSVRWFLRNDPTEYPVQLTAVATLVQAIGIISLVAALAVSLGIVFDGVKTKALTDMPVGQIVAPLMEGLMSVAIGLTCMVALNYIDGLSGGGSASGGGNTGNVGGGSGNIGAVTAEVEALRTSLSRARLNSDALNGDLEAFRVLVAGIGKLLVDLNDFFPDQNAGGKN